MAGQICPLAHRTKNDTRMPSDWLDCVSPHISETAYEKFVKYRGQVCVEIAKVPYRGEKKHKKTLGVAPKCGYRHTL